MSRFLLALACLCVLLAGCGEPLAKDAVPDRPSPGTGTDPTGQPSIPHASGSLTVSTLPLDTIPDQGVVNCFFVAPSSEEIVPLENATLILDWTPESELAARLSVRASNGAEASASAGGPSPLTFSWSSDNGPALMPFKVQVGPEDATSVVASQEVTYTIFVNADVQSIEVVEAPCEG